MIWSIFHYIFLNIEPGEKQFLYASIEARSSIFAIRAFSQNEGQSKKKKLIFFFEPIGPWLDCTVVDIKSRITHGSNILISLFHITKWAKIV